MAIRSLAGKALVATGVFAAGLGLGVYGQSPPLPSPQTPVVSPVKADPVANLTTRVAALEATEIAEAGEIMTLGRATVALQKAVADLQAIVGGLQPGPAPTPVPPPTPDPSPAIEAAARDYYAWLPNAYRAWADALDGTGPDPGLAAVNQNMAAEHTRRAAAIGSLVTPALNAPGDRKALAAAVRKVADAHAAALRAAADQQAKKGDR